jgi:hypothetical protein
MKEGRIRWMKEGRIRWTKEGCIRQIEGRIPRRSAMIAATPAGNRVPRMLEETAW